MIQETKYGLVFLIAENPSEVFQLGRIQQMIDTIVPETVDSVCSAHGVYATSDAAEEYKNEDVSLCFGNIFQLINWISKFDAEMPQLRVKLKPLPQPS